MTTQVSPSAGQQNRWLRPLIPILVVFAVGVVFLFIGNAIASATAAAKGESAAPLDAVKFLPYLVVGAAVTYSLSLLATDEKLWVFGTREVVYAAIGAALYGVLAWATNIIQLPSISLISLRPAIVIPIFFGITFGPAVGFFVGFVGNVLGDALTGWGVFPIWDVGNGLIGLVSGLAVVFANRKRSLDVVTVIIAAAGVVVSLLIFANPVFPNPFDPATTIDLSGTWWIPLVVVGLVAGVRYLLRNRPELASAQVWGAFGIVIGIGFAALADIWWNGYSLPTTILGQFVPAALSNIVNSLILLPLLLTAWNAARARSGR